MNKMILKNIKYVLDPTSCKPVVGFGFFNQKTEKWDIEKESREKFDTKYKRLDFVKYVLWGLVVGFLFGWFVTFLLKK